MLAFNAGGPVFDTSWWKIFQMPSALLVDLPFIFLLYQ
jgi:hypothetical protein